MIYCHLNIILNTAKLFGVLFCPWELWLMLPSLEMDSQLLVTTKYIMLMIVCIFPRMLKTFWARGWNFLKQFANMKYCTYQIGPTTIFPRPFIIAHKSSPHFLFLKDLAYKEDVGFKSELVNQSWEQSSNDFHLLIFYFNEEQCIWIYCWCDHQFYSLSRFFSLYSACSDVLGIFIRTGQKKNIHRINFRKLSILSGL